MIASNKKEIITDSFARSNPHAVLLLSLAHSQGFTVKAKPDSRRGMSSAALFKPIPRQNTGKLISLGKRRQEAVTWKEASYFKRFKEDPTYKPSPVPSVCSPIPDSQEVVDYLSMSEDQATFSTAAGTDRIQLKIDCAKCINFEKAADKSKQLL
jgi:hypothetical protein